MSGGSEGIIVVRIDGHYGERISLTRIRWDWILARLRAAESGLATVSKALGECLADFEDASAYKGEYLAEKHGDAKAIAEYRAILDAVGRKPRKATA